MSGSISLREANQAFARCIRGVEAGKETASRRRLRVAGHTVYIMVPRADVSPDHTGNALWLKQIAKKLLKY
jgi:antitoxin (DNA-binding transcriptional repressor) of toxin-antitoxin stability system